MARKLDEGEGVKKSKAFAYRDAEAKLGVDADLEKVQEHIRSNFGLEMSKAQISQYRSTEKRRTKSSGKGRKGMKKARLEGETLEIRETASKSARTDAMIEFVSAMRGWESKIGADKICEMIDALYKKN